MHDRFIFSVVIFLYNIIFLEAVMQVTSTVSKITVALNDFASINVQFSQTPVSVNWVHQNINGSQTTIAIDGTKYFNSPLTDLTIYPVGRYDFGFYDCNASDGVDNYHLELPVLLFETGTPSVESSMTSLDIDPIGQTIELDCTYTDSHVPSDPSMEPDVRWLHCDVSHICSRIDKGNNLKYSGSNVTHPSLTILLYAEDDFGTYWCQVENEVGTSSSHVIKLTGTVNTMVETTTTTITIPDSMTTIPDATTTTQDSTTTTIPDSTTKIPDSTTTRTTTIPDSTTTTPDSTTTTIPDLTTTITIPDSTTTTPDSTTTTIPDSTTTTTIPDSTTTTTIPDSTTTTTTTIPDSTTTTPDSTTTTIPDSTTTTTIPDSTTTIPDSTITTIPDSTTTTKIPHSTLTSIFITSANVTTGQCGGYNRDEKAIFIQYAGAKGSIGHIEYKINIRSSIRCALHCLQCDNCNGYNYQKSTGTCQLLESSLSNYEISSSWDFYFQHI